MLLIPPDVRTPGLPAEPALRPEKHGVDTTGNARRAEFVKTSPERVRPLTLFVPLTRENAIPAAPISASLQPRDEAVTWSTSGDVGANAFDVILGVLGADPADRDQAGAPLKAFVLGLLKHSTEHAKAREETAGLRARRRCLLPASRPPGLSAGRVSGSRLWPFCATGSAKAASAHSACWRERSRPHLSPFWHFGCFEHLFFLQSPALSCPLAKFAYSAQGNGLVTPPKIAPA